MGGGGGEGGGFGVAHIKGGQGCSFGREVGKRLASTTYRGRYRYRLEPQENTAFIFSC